MKVIVTGAAGKVGSFVVTELSRSGHEVIGVDMKKGDLAITYRRADLLNLGEALWALEGGEVVVHFAGIPEAWGDANHKIFSTNVSITCNVFEAARILGIKRVIIASSVSAYGFVFTKRPFMPKYFPIDEEHPLLVQDCYALSKKTCEEIAATYNRQIGIDAICIRFPWAILPEFYNSLFLAWIHNIPEEATRRHFWTYCDVRDIAQAFRLAAEYPDNLGFEIFNINAYDTFFSPLPTIKLIDRYAPDVPIKDEEKLKDTQPALAIDKAKRILGFKPQYSWNMFVNDFEKYLPNI